MNALLGRIDRFQQRNRLFGFLFAVNKKYGEDNGGYLAAIITYYAFFSIFPLLLAFTTILGYVLRGHPKLEQSIVNSALGQFPVIGKQLTAGSLHGSVIALVIGLAGALWAGMGVFLAAQYAMNQLWGVPYRRRPGFVSQRLRALGLLGLLGGGALATTVLAGLGTFGAQYGVLWKIGSIALSLALDFGLFWVAFKVLTTHDVSWSCLRGGAIAAAIAYEILQSLGGYYVGHVLANSSNTYGTFALVIGLLTWIYLTAHILLMTAEGNVVAERHLYPRTLLQTSLPTEADRRALRQRAEVEERHPAQDVEVEFEPARQAQTVAAEHRDG